jgi:hypothetical protein
MTLHKTSMALGLSIVALAVTASLNSISAQVRRDNYGFKGVPNYSQTYRYRAPQANFEMRRRSEMGKRGMRNIAPRSLDWEEDWFDDFGEGDQLDGLRARRGIGRR